MRIRYWRMAESSLSEHKANSCSSSFDMERVLVVRLESDGDYDSEQYNE